MSQHVEEEFFEPKLKKKKIDQCNKTYSEQTKLLFLDALDDHYYNSLLRKKLCSPTVVCLEKAELEQLNTFDLQGIIKCCVIHQEKQWLITLGTAGRIKVFDIESGQLLFNSEQTYEFEKLSIVESKNILYGWEKGHYWRLLLDLDKKLPVLSVGGIGNNVIDTAYCKSRDELLVLFENGVLSVYDEEILLGNKCTKFGDNISSIHYNELSDELWAFYQSDVSGNSLRKYCGKNLNTCKQVCNFKKELSGYKADLLFDLEFENFYIVNESFLELELYDKSTLSLLKRIEITGDIYCNKKTQTIIEVKEGKAFEYRLKLDTCTIDIPIDRKICNHLESIGAKIPKLFIRDRTIPDSINYLTQIKPDTKFKFVVFEKEVVNLVHKIYDMHMKQYLTNAHDIAQFLPNNSFEFKLVNNYEKPLETIFPNEPVSYIGLNFKNGGSFYIGVVHSELRQLGQCLTDFPIYIGNTSRFLKKVFLKIKLSDFVQALSLVAHHGDYLFDLPFIYEKLKAKSLISPLTLEMDEKKLLETYRTFSTQCGKDNLKEILNSFQEQNVKINGKYYQIVDLLLLCYCYGILIL